MRTEGPDRRGTRGHRSTRHAWLLLIATALAPAAPAQPPPPRGALLEPRAYAPGPFDSLRVDGAGQVRLYQADRDEVLVPGDRRTQDSVRVARETDGLHVVLGGPPDRRGEP